MAKGDKYINLTIYLKSSNKNSIELTLDELEKITGGLPPSVYNHGQASFSKSSKHSLSYGWINAGYNVVPNLKENKVTFNKNFDTPESKVLESKTLITKSKKSKGISIHIEKPNVEIVKKYLNKWNSLENYTVQEEALSKLFNEIYPKNNDMNDVLIKIASLNYFYSTNIFSIYPVAKYYVDLNMDERLQNGDLSLVDELSKVPGRDQLVYSFATKYCSHHQPNIYPIYDSYVDKMLCHFKKEYSFANFEDNDLKKYHMFKDVINQFQKYFLLEEFTVKEIDKYLWLCGKEYFPRKK